MRSATSPATASSPTWRIIMPGSSFGTHCSACRSRSTIMRCRASSAGCGCLGEARNFSLVSTPVLTVSDVMNDDAAPALQAEQAPRFGLSAKLLLLTVLFVMVAEVFIYVPSIANFRLNWLNDRLAAAHTAALVLDAAPSSMVPDSLARQLLDSIG